MLAAFLVVLLIHSDDPWSADVESAAEAAVAKLGANRALAIRPEVLNIVGLEAQGIVANVSEVKAAMNALNAQETATEITIELPADVLFDFDKSDIRPD